MKRGREKEALVVLSRINGHNNKEEFVDSVLELKELRESTTVNSTQSFSVVIKQIFQWKYRYSQVKQHQLTPNSLAILAPSLQISSLLYHFFPIRKWWDICSVSKIVERLRSVDNDMAHHAMQILHHNIFLRSGY